MVQKSRRRIIREQVLQVLFAYEMNKDSLQYLKDEILTDVSSKTELEFANDLINKTVEHVKEFDVMIKGRVDNWEIGRIALIDKILIQIGICELLYFPDIPPKVTINESLEIAKEYSTARSA
ncbi:MAG: transcription antitermination factor NusB, partial [Ignavibacteriaceae bacterium]